MTTQQDERAELIAALRNPRRWHDLTDAQLDAAAALLQADAEVGGEAVAWRDGVNVARLRASLTRMGIATEPSEEGTAADLENWVNALTRAVTRPPASSTGPLTPQQADALLEKFAGGADWSENDYASAERLIRMIEAAHGITGKE